MARFTLPKEYLSVSQINMYLRCGAQYEFRYLKNIKSPPGVAMLRGSAYHKGMEAYYGDVIAGNSRMEPKQVAEYCVVSLEELAEESDVKLEGSEKDSAVVALQNAVEPYITYVAPLMRPVAVESELRYTSSCGVEILGYIDLERLPTEYELKAAHALKKAAGGDYDPAEVEEEMSIVDYKVSGKKWAPGKLGNDLQFHVYTMARGIPNVEIHNLTVTDKKPKINKQVEADYTAPVQDIATNVRMLRHRFDGSEHSHIENTIEGVAKGISAGVFMRCSMDSWVCDSRFCGYYHLCRGKK